MLAKFKCLGCGYEYEDKPGPTTCPQCKHFWIKWLNYEEWRKKHPILMNKDRQIIQG